MPYMRTTIVIDDLLEKKIRNEVHGRRLSEFVNRCITEYFERQEYRQYLKDLEMAYRRASKAGQEKTEEEPFDTIDQEEWPIW
jgi:hypothetical protein